MQLEAVYRLVFKRRLQRMLRLSLPMPLLQAAVCGLVTGMLYFVLSLTLSAFDWLPPDIRYSIAYKLLFVIMASPVLFGFIMAARSQDGSNESALALPISRLVWAKVLNKMQFMLILPAMAGSWVAYGLVLHFSLDLEASAVAVLLSLACLYASLLYVLCYRLSVWRACLVRVLHKQVITWLPAAGAAGLSYLVARYGMFRLEDGQAVISQKPLMFWILYGGMCWGGASAAGRIVQMFGRSVAQAAYKSPRAKRLRFTGLISRPPLAVAAVVIAGSLRNPNVWLLYSVSVAGTLAAVVAGDRMNNANFVQMVVGALPVLLIVACLSLAISARSMLGGQRSAIYTLPHSTRWISASIWLVCLGMSLVTISGVTYFGNALLDQPAGWQLLGRSLVLATLTAGVSALISIVFFEARAELTKGALSAVATVAMASPLLMADAWLRERALWVHAATGLAACAVLIAVTVTAERQLTIRETA